MKTLGLEDEKTEEAETASTKTDSPNHPPRDEIETKIKTGYVWSKDNAWVKPPNKNKKCHCGSTVRYKLCCQDADTRMCNLLLKSLEGPAKSSSETSSAEVAFI